MKLSSDEVTLANTVWGQAAKILTTGSTQLDGKKARVSKSQGTGKSLTKRTFGESLVNIVSKGEPAWAGWKKVQCPDFVKHPQNSKIKDKLASRRNSKAQ